MSGQYPQSPDDTFPREAILRRAAGRPGGTLLVVGHGGHAAGGDAAHGPLPTAAEVLTALDLDPAACEVERCESAPRVVTDHDGRKVSVPDEIVQARRR